MEVIHSTNIVFNTKQPRSTTTGNGKGLYKNPRSPVESKNVTKQGLGTNGGTTSLKRAESLESQMKSIQDSPVCLTDTPKFYSPTKVGVPLPTVDAPRVEESPLFRRVHDLPGHPVLDTPLSWKNKESPSDSGIEMTPLSVSPAKVNPKLRSMYNNSRREADESTDFSINPDPVPYQSSNFMSSTMMKKVPVARRHFDTFGTYDFMAGIAKRGMMLHTDRYQWDLAKALDGLSQRERLQAELEYMERLRGIKRRREVLPHRAQLDLLMGGKKVEFNERFEIQREIQKLKSLILPEHAKDLFHGRGFTLPGNHNSLKPRRPFDPNMDLADELSSPFSPDKYSINPETGRVQPKIRQYPVDQSSSLPKINSKGYLLGHGSPIILSKEKRTVESIKARLRIPTSSSSQAYMTRSKTNVTTGGPNKPAGIGGRSLTAQQAKKDPRHPVTAPTTKPAHVLQKPDITIPVSAREPDEPEDASPVLPKSTPATSKNVIEEETDDIVLEEWPEVEETTNIPTGNESRNDMSRLSAARSVTSPSKAPTPNPLKAVELVKTISEDEQARLKQTFNKLDTDKDGHIMFSQLQTQLPKQFSQAQEKYIKQVYDITSSNTFFGVDEFMTMSYLTNVVTNLTGEPRDAYNKLEFYGLNDVILKYVELFQTVDRNHRGKIALSSLQEILHTALSIDFKTEPPIWNKIVDTIETNEPMTITKIEFLAHIPYFQTLERRK